MHAKKDYKTPFDSIFKITLKIAVFGDKLAAPKRGEGEGRVATRLQNSRVQSF